MVNYIRIIVINNFLIFSLFLCVLLCHFLTNRLVHSRRNNRQNCSLIQKSGVSRLHHLKDCTIFLWGSKWVKVSTFNFSTSGKREESYWCEFHSKEWWFMVLFTTRTFPLRRDSLHFVRIWLTLPSRQCGTPVANVKVTGKIVRGLPTSTDTTRVFWV